MGEERRFVCPEVIYQNNGVRVVRKPSFYSSSEVLVVESLVVTFDEMGKITEYWERERDQRVLLQALGFVKPASAVDPSEWPPMMKQHVSSGARVRRW